MKGVAELDGFCNVMFHCFDHEIVLEGMKEEISQQRCTIGANWYTNNLPENRASKTNDVVDKKVNSEINLSTREVCVPHGHPIIGPEGAKIEGVKAFQCYGSKRKDYSRMQNHDENQQRK